MSLATPMENYRHKQIHDLLLSAKRPVFISDERIDGDSLGASLAMADFMAQRDMKVPVYVPTAVPGQYMGLPRVDLCTFDKDVFNDDQIDVVVVFDCSDDVYVKSLVDLIPGDPTVVNIDHHATNNRFGDINQVIVGAPATAYVIYHFFEANNIIPSRDAATCMLTGICFDTSAFSNGATNDSSLDVSSKLVLHGARIQDVIRTMFMNRSVSALRVWGAALERLTEYPESSAVTTYLTRKDIEENLVTDDEIDGLSNFLNLVTDTDTLCVLRETVGGDVKASMRSLTRDVSEIATRYKGGGHKRAAGYTIEGANLHCDETGKWCVLSADGKEIEITLS